jgi:lysophospholipase L1-like esterase
MQLLKNRNTQHIAVLNLGIGGNCVLKGGIGPTALNRFDRDVLGQNGVRWLIILEGINDITGTKDSATASLVVKNLITAYDKMIGEAHAKGIKVYGATITPLKNSSYYTDYREAARNAVNEWVRTSGHFDAVIDLDKVIRDPADISALLPAAQSDHLHPNELGYKMFGEAIDLSLFK